MWFFLIVAGMSVLLAYNTMMDYSLSQYIPTYNFGTCVPQQYSGDADTDSKFLTVQNVLS